MVKITVPAGEPDSGGRQPLPAGTYCCTVGKIDVDQTRTGHEWWRVTLGVVDGPYFGRKIRDSLFFTEKALPRAIQFCRALGLKLHGTTEVTPSMCQGRQCMVSVHSETYRDRDGNERERNAVDFEGYATVPESEPGQFTPPAPMDDDDDLPF